MRSQSLFNFFTKAADTYKSAAAPGQNPQGDVRPQTTAKPKPAYDLAQLKKTVDSDYAAYDSMYGTGAGDTGSTRLAYSNYMSSLARAYARGSITRDEYYARRDYIRDRLATEQFDDMYNSYHTWTNRDKYGDKATDPGRMSMAMVDDTNRRRYIFKRGAGSPANMTYAQFRDNFIIDPKTGKPISKSEARLKWNSMWQRSAGPYTGNSGVPAGGSVPGSGVPQDDSWRDAASQQWDATVTAYNNNSKNAGTPLTFQGGHIVNYDPSYVKDWTRYTKNNPANNNVGGTWYNNEQYLSYHDISDQLYNSMVNSGGMNPKQAKAEASRLTKAYLDDQMEIARGGTARNQWMEQPSASGAPADPTATTTAVTNNPVAPHSADLNVNAPHIYLNNDGTVGYQNTPSTTLRFNTADNVQVPSALTPATEGQSVLTLDGIGSTGENSLYNTNTLNFSGGSLTLGPLDSSTGSVTATVPTVANTTDEDTKVVTPIVQKQPDIRPVVTTTPKSDNNVTSTVTTPITWSVNDGLKDPTGYIKYHTRTRDADTLRRWNKGKLSTREYSAGMAGSHYNNMQNLYALARNPGLNPTQKRAVMRALYREAVLFGEFSEDQNASGRGYLDDPYNPNHFGTTERVDNSLAEHGIMGHKKYMKHNSFIPDDIKEFIASYDNY